MSAWSDFWHMGGYAFFVWTSYAIVIVVLLANIWFAVWKSKDTRHRLRQRFALEDPQQKQAKPPNKQ